MALIPLYTVEADVSTGEWLGEAQEIGTIDEASLQRQQDTDHDHWDTFECAGRTCGVRVMWKNARIWRPLWDGEGAVIEP